VNKNQGVTHTSWCDQPIPATASKLKTMARRLREETSYKSNVRWWWKTTAAYVSSSTNESCGWVNIECLWSLFSSAALTVDVRRHVENLGKTDVVTALQGKSTVEPRRALYVNTEARRQLHVDNNVNQLTHGPRTSHYMEITHLDLHVRFLSTTWTVTTSTSIITSSVLTTVLHINVGQLVHPQYTSLVGSWRERVTSLSGLVFRWDQTSD